MPSTYCFVGPSLPDAAELVVGTDIQLLPPVAAGDLLRLELRPGDVVAIIDGYFHQTRSVRHKEILDLLGREIRVLGASSMGALRAAELDRFGMRGIGGVYADYRDGRLEADDEVTLLHSPREENYRPHSEPLVCIRATFAAAVREGVCTAATAERLLGLLARRPFGLRTYTALPEVGAEAGVEGDTVRSLQRYCVAHRRDPKRDDALLLLDELRNPSEQRGPDQLRHSDAIAGDDDRPTTPPRVHRTSFLYSWQLVARTVGADSNDPAEAGATEGRSAGGRNVGSVGALDLLRACQLFAADYPEYHRTMALRTLVSRCAAECGRSAASTGSDPSRWTGTNTDTTVDMDADAVRALRHGEHHGLYRLPARRERLPFLHLWLTPDETELSLTEQLTTALVRSCRITLRLPWEEIAVEHLSASVVPEAVRLVRLAEQVNDRALRDRPDVAIAAIPRARVVDLLADTWSTPPDMLELAAFDRGFVSLDNAVSAARPFYLLARYNDVADQLRVTIEPRSDVTSGA